MDGHSRNNIPRSAHTRVVNIFIIRIDDFARLFSVKLGIAEDELKLGLWGDYYLNAKTKKICPGAQEKAKKPLFPQVALENVWSVYEAVMRKDWEKIDKIVERMQLTLTARDRKCTDTRQLIQVILGKWLPLSNCVLGMLKFYL